MHRSVKNGTNKDITEMCLLSVVEDILNGFICYLVSALNCELKVVKTFKMYIFIFLFIELVLLGGFEVILIVHIYFVNGLNLQFMNER